MFMLCWLLWVVDLLVVLKRRSNALRESWSCCAAKHRPRKVTIEFQFVIKSAGKHPSAGQGSDILKSRLQTIVVDSCSDHLRRVAIRDRTRSIAKERQQTMSTLLMVNALHDSSDQLAKKTAYGLMFLFSQVFQLVINRRI